MRSYTNLNLFWNRTSQNSNAENSALFGTLTNTTQRTLLQKYFNNETSIQINTVADQQAYKFPQNYSKMKTVQIKVGAIDYPLTEVLTRKEWDLINMYTWTSNIPAWYFIYNGVVEIFPIPSSVNTITYNYKLRATDLSIQDTTGSGNPPVPANPLVVSAGSVSIALNVVNSISVALGGTGYTTATNVPTTGGTGTGLTVDITAVAGVVTAAVINNPGLDYSIGDLPFISGGDGTAQIEVLTVTGGTTVIGVGTSWNPTVGINESRWIQVPFPYGDNQWYQIASVDSATHITLYNSYQGTVSVSGSTSFTMGQMPILMEDFHDMLVYEPLMIYFASIQPDATKFEKFKGLYDAGIERLNAYAGSKSTGVSLEGPRTPINGNLFQTNIGELNP